MTDDEWILQANLNSARSEVVEAACIFINELPEEGSDPFDRLWRAVRALERAKAESNDAPS